MCSTMPDYLAGSRKTRTAFQRPCSARARVDVSRGAAKKRRRVGKNVVYTGTAVHGCAQNAPAEISVGMPGPFQQNMETHWAVNVRSCHTRIQTEPVPLPVFFVCWNQQRCCFATDNSGHAHFSLGPRHTRLGRITPVTASVTASCSCLSHFRHAQSHRHRTPRCRGYALRSFLAASLPPQAHFANGFSAS